MAFTPKNGMGSIFKNNKGDNPARPDYRGDIMLGDVLYEISGWIKPKVSNPDEKFMSLSGKPKEAAAPAARPAAKPEPEFDDDMPF